MGKYVQSGEMLDYLNTTLKPINFGDVVMLGTHPAIAANTINPNEYGIVATSGVFEFNKDSSAFEIGADVYVTEEGEATSTVSSNKKVGYCIKKVETGDTTVLIKLSD